MSPPTPGEKVPGVTSKYFNARNRRRLFNFLTREFEKSGITRAELAVRTGKSRALISRLLGQPSNLTADTAEELLFAISGGEIEYHVVYPLSRETSIEYSTGAVATSHNGLCRPENIVRAIYQRDRLKIAPVGTVPLDLRYNIEVREAA